MEFRHLKMALLVPDDSLWHFSQLKISFINQNETAFIRDRCCHLTLCLHLMEADCQGSKAKKFPTRSNLLFDHSRFRVTGCLPINIGCPEFHLRRVRSFTTPARSRTRQGRGVSCRRCLLVKSRSLISIKSKQIFNELI